MLPIHHLSGRLMMLYGPELDRMKAAASEPRPQSAMVDTFQRFESLPTEQLGSTACIPIHGPIHGDETYWNAMWACMFGGVGQSEITAAIKAALDDDAIDSIILDIDSPGGEAMGTGELAAYIRQANAVKPITAYISGMGCSAAYYLASATGKIVCDPSAMIGSIGTVICFMDDSKAMEKAGYKEIEIVSTQSPHKRPDPATPAGRAAYQAMVDEMSHVFVSDVAKYRGVSESKVLNDFGGGGVLIGAEAVKVGLADSVGSLQSCLAAIRQNRGPAPSPGRMNPTATQGERPVDWKQFFGLARNADPAKLDAAAALLDGEPEATAELPIGNSPEPVAEAVDTGIVAALEAKIAAAEEKAKAALAQVTLSNAAKVFAEIEKDVLAFANALKTDAKAVPAVLSALEPLYRAALCIENGQPLPDGFSLSATVKALADALPANPLGATHISQLPEGAAILKQDENMTEADVKAKAKAIHEQHYK